MNFMSALLAYGFRSRAHGHGSGAADAPRDIAPSPAKISHSGAHNFSTS
jgi:hypothetical protein